MTDPVTNLDRYLAELRAHREEVVKQMRALPNPRTQASLQQLLEQIDQFKEKFEASRPDLEALKARLLELEQPAPPPPPTAAPAAPPVPPGWPLSDEHIHAMIRGLVQRAHPPAAKTAIKPPKADQGDVKDISSSTWNAEALPSTKTSDVRDIDSSYWKQADEESAADSDDWQG